MSEVWDTIFEVSAEAGGCFDDQEYEAIFRAKLREVTADPKVRAVRGKVLTAGVTANEVLGDLPVVVGFRIDVQHKE